MSIQRKPLPKKPVTVAVSPYRKIAYTREFGGFLKKNRGLFEQFLRIRKEGLKKFSIGKIKISEINVPRSFASNCWKVENEREAFFVKETPTYEERALDGLRNPSAVEAIARGNRGYAGAEQLMAMRKLEQILKENKTRFPNIKIAEWHLGYTGEKTSLFVAKFYNLPRVSELSEGMLPESIDDEFEKFRKFGRQTGFFDVERRNAFYDRNARKIIVFDVWDLRKREKYAFQENSSPIGWEGKGTR
ncbi:MAG: hypothetical protein WC602_02165 [archaeon]